MSTGLDSGAAIQPSGRLEGNPHRPGAVGGGMESLWSTFHRWVRPVLDVGARLILPTTCPVCGESLGPEPGRLRLPVLWCAGCGAWLERQSGGPAVRLGGWTAQGRYWYEGPVAEAIRRVKEGGAGAGVLLDRLADGWRPASLPGPQVRLVPVPSAALRRRERGGDHVDRLARRWARAWGVGVARPLRRRGGGHQIGLGARERLANLSGQYGPAKRPGVPGPVWLVDDVVTTGATLLACARILEEGGWRVEGAVALACTPAPALRGEALAEWEHMALEVHEDDPHAPEKIPSRHSAEV